MIHADANRPTGDTETEATGTIRLRDGRTLGYGAWGLPGGIPVLGVHGTGGSRLFHYGDEVPRAAGVRLILPDRPGYGLSDTHPGCTLLDWARDVEEVANALRFDRFAVFGVSGGGPSALLCGFALPDRVTAVGLVSSVGPCQDEPEIVPHLPERRRRLVELARRDPAAAEAMIRRDCEEDIAAIARDPEASLDAWPPGTPDSDRALMADPVIRARALANRHELARRGPEGNVHDHLLNYAKPWGFRVADIRVPVHIWHGAQDTVAPVEAARLLAQRIPEARLTVFPGVGHLGTYRHIAEILQTLAVSV